MRRRAATSAARAFVRERYPSLAHRRIVMMLEDDGRRSRSWAFVLSADEEDGDHGRDEGYVGYVHADGYVNGLY